MVAGSKLNIHMKFLGEDPKKPGHFKFMLAEPRMDSKTVSVPIHEVLAPKLTRLKFGEFYDVTLSQQFVSVADIFGGITYGTGGSRTPNRPMGGRGNMNG